MPQTEEPKSKYSRHFADPEQGYQPVPGDPTAQNSDKNGHKAKRKPWTKKKKVLFGVLGVVVLALILGGVAIAVYISHINRNLAMDPASQMALQQSLVAPTEGQPYYVLVVGSDSRDTSDAGRSDTIMLCRVDPNAKVVSILSIPRDTKVELPGYGTQKINAAMAFNGPAGAVNAISDFVGVPISHYIEIDFSGFKDIVDALGGVTVTVPPNTTYQGVTVPAGKQLLNGDQALVFVRCRKTYATGDFQRAANQRQLLKAVAKQVLSSSPTSMPGLISSISGNVKTDMTTQDIIAMATSLRGMDTDTDMYTGQVPSTTATINKISYVLPIDDEWNTVRQRFIDGVVPFVTADEAQPNVQE